MGSFYPWRRFLCYLPNAGQIPRTATIRSVLAAAGAAESMEQSWNKELGAGRESNPLPAPGPLFPFPAPSILNPSRCSSADGYLHVPEETQIGRRGANPARNLSS